MTVEARLEALDRELRELEARLARMEGLGPRLDDLRRQWEERKAQMEACAQTLRKEEGDVEVLERGGLRSFLAGLAGDREERLDRERREAVAAKLRYDQAVQDVDYLDRQIRDLLRERDELQAQKARRDALLGEKEALLKAQGGQRGERLAELERRMAQLRGQCREREEAQRAGREAELALSAVLDSLDRASGFGTWDMLGGGLFVTMAKHESLDDARAGISRAQRALSDLRAELADVGDIQVPQVSVGEFATFADYFFDGLIADWAVQSSIHQSQDRVSEVHVHVLAALRRLEELERQQEAQAAALEEERAGLLRG